MIELTISQKDKQEISSLVNKLFDYIDNNAFDKMQTEVFADSVLFDVTSAGGYCQDLTSKQVCDIFKMYMSNIDGNNRTLGEFLMKINGNEAEVFTTATITHFKKGTKNGNTREFQGDYQLGLVKSDTKPWRINSFIYVLHHKEGNITLE